MANTMLKMGKEFGKDVAKIALYTTYPILGNLSGKLKMRIEKKCPHFNEKVASKLTDYANPVIYPVLAGYCFDQIVDPENTIITAGVVAGATIFGVLEAVVRVGEDKRLNEYGHNGHNASLVGKVISLAPEYIINLHDRAKTSSYETTNKPI